LNGEEPTEGGGHRKEKNSARANTRTSRRKMCDTSKFRGKAQGKGIGRRKKKIESRTI